MIEVETWDPFLSKDPQHGTNGEGIQMRKSHFKWVSCQGSEHRAQMTRVVTSEWGDDIRMHMDVVHGNRELNEQRTTLFVMTNRQDI